jgi:hypothetical protein
VSLALISAPLFAIVGGELDSGNEFPNVGAVIATDHPSIPTPQTVSTATLIHPRVVLTAGHTVELIRSMVVHPAIDLEDFAVVFTVDAHDGTGTEYRIAETHLHAGYSGRDAGSIDVGLLVLEEAVLGITPVALPEAGFLNELDPDRGPSGGKPSVIVAGYGNTELTPPDGSFPAGERRVAAATFKSLRPEYLMLSQNFALGEGGISRGDSGAPALWDDDGTLVQVAVMVNGDHASASYGSGVRTDIQTVIDFIQDVIEGVEE